MVGKRKKRAKAHPVKQKRETWAEFVPSFPARWLRVVEKANAHPALPLLLALHRQFSLRGNPSSILLTASVWATIGVNERVGRIRVLRHARQLPELLILNWASSFVAHFRVTRGPEWDLEDAELGPIDEPALDRDPSAQSEDAERDVLRAANPIPLAVRSAVTKRAGRFCERC